jgi:hypothetical protein
VGHMRKGTEWESLAIKDIRDAATVVAREVAAALER